MSILQGILFFVLFIGFTSSSSADNLLLNICFTIGSCRSSDTYLKLTPSNFNSNSFDYTIHIPRTYPSYTTTGPMLVEFYVVMNASNVGYDTNGVAKSVLFDANGKKVLVQSDLAYSSNEMLLISTQLWQPKNQVTLIDNDNQVTTKLIVYRFDSNNMQQSDPYNLTFKRNE